MGEDRKMESSSNSVDYGVCDGIRNYDYFLSNHFSSRKVFVLWFGCGRVC